MGEVANKLIPIKLNLVFTYSYNEDTCPICNNYLTHSCVECVADNKDSCDLSQGKCGHIFHRHCIRNWLTKQQQYSCPVDQTQFVYDKEILDDPNSLKHLSKRSKINKNESINNINALKAAKQTTETMEPPLLKNQYPI